MWCKQGVGNWTADGAAVSQRGEVFCSDTDRHLIFVERDLVQPLSSAGAAQTGQTFTQAFMCSDLYKNFVLTHCTAQESCLRKVCAPTVQLLRVKERSQTSNQAGWSRKQSRSRVAAVVEEFVGEDAGSYCPGKSTAVWTRCARSPMPWRNEARFWSMKPGWRSLGGTGGSSTSWLRCQLCRTRPNSLLFSTSAGFTSTCCTSAA